MPFMRQKKRCLAAIQTTCLLALAANAAAENIFSLSSSGSQPLPGELPPSQQGGRVGLSLPDALRDERAGLSAAPSYGLRFSHYPERHPNWGIGVDFTRYSASAGTPAQDAGSGIWRSALAPDATPLDRVAQRFDQPQGVNVLSVSGIYRWREDGPTVGRLQPYVGVGLAWYRSNSDGTTPGFAHPPVENTALGYHMLGGVRYHFTERAGAFFEAKFNSGNGMNAAPRDPDGAARSYHAVAGVSYSF
jgi:hypothetical protein